MAFKGEVGCLVKDSRWVVHMFVAGPHTFGESSSCWRHSYPSDLGQQL
jgi:hypothetical protein